MQHNSQHCKVQHKWNPALEDCGGGGGRERWKSCCDPERTASWTRQRQIDWTRLEAVGAKLEMTKRTLSQEN